MVHVMLVRRPGGFLTSDTLVKALKLILSLFGFLCLLLINSYIQLIKVFDMKPV